ncbi:MAG: C45 family autoproteolytic acyltransferase/hydrolase [Planctomycetota bacterium]
MAFPVIDLSGPARQRGLTHGRALRERIHENLAVYFARFEREAGLERREVLDRAARYERALADQAPDYAAAMRGVAEGAGCELVEIAALNARYELLYHRWGEQLLVDGCTAFAVLPARSATGALLAGQNWDWLPGVRGAIVRVRRDDRDNGPDSVAFTEAGIVGAKIGFNSAGITLGVNGMMSVGDDWSRLRRPFHVRCDDVLAAATFDDAVRAVADEPRNCSANFAISGLPDRAVSLETAPDRLNHLTADDSGCVVHSNHFVDPAAIGVIEPPNERRPHSYFRRARLGELIASSPRVSIADLQGWLADHHGSPEGLCRHGLPGESMDERIVTVTAAIIEPAARCMHITDGPPCTSAWQTVTL